MGFENCRQCEKNEECPLQLAAKFVKEWLSFADVDIDLMPTNLGGCRIIARPKEAQQAVNIMLLLIYKEMTGIKTAKDLETYLISKVETIGSA